MVEPLTTTPNGIETMDKQKKEVRGSLIEGLDTLIGAEVYLAHGDRNEIAKVIKRKRDNDRNFIEWKHNNPALDSCIFIVEFPDENQHNIGYNILAESLYSEMDSEGKQFRLICNIINHIRSKGALEKDDRWRISKVKRHKKLTLTGWELEVEWADSNASWLPLRELKETNMVETAEYAKEKSIIDEPAFDWWAPLTLKKKNRLIKASKKWLVGSRYKFGIKIPNTVQEALELDKTNGNTLCLQAIRKEMANVIIAFKVLEPNDTLPIRYTKVPLKMIFDLKLDSKCKARLVAGGHMTNTPTKLTYSSVLSRDSIRICFLIAILNDLDIQMTDVGNTYLKNVIQLQGRNLERTNEIQY